MNIPQNTYQVRLCALDTILKHAFDISETSPDNREAADNGTIQGYSSSQTRIATQRYYNRQRREPYQKQATTTK
jgi:hypothetical protein